MSDADLNSPRFSALIDFLARIPAMETNDTPAGGFSSGGEGGAWWVKFSLDIDHDLAWETVQEMGHALNSLTGGEGLATSFKPVSPPPYLNGGPEEFLSWIIEAPDSVTPEAVAEWLEARMPDPVDDVHAWGDDADEDEGEDDDDTDDGDGDGGEDET